MTSTQSDRYTLTANGRTWRLYGCAKRGCDAINPDHKSFGTSDGKGWCLNHIPRRARLGLWWQERRFRSSVVPTDLRRLLVPETVERKVWVCDGCSSWTDKEITRDELLAITGYCWEEGDDDLGEPGYVPVYCPECV